MIIQAAVGALLLVIFLIAATYNGLVFLRPAQVEQGPSVVPVFGGLAGSAGVWLWPYHDLAAWAWLPLILDYGCGSYLLGGLFLTVRNKWRYRPGNCFARLTGETDARRVEIRLYRGGRLQIEEDFRDPGKFASFSSAGRWTRSASGNGYLLDIWDATITLEPENGQWQVLEEHGWFSEELRLAPMAFKEASRSLS